MRVIVAVAYCLPAARCLRYQPARFIIFPAALQPVRVYHRRQLVPVVIVKFRLPPVRCGDVRDIAGHHIQTVLCPPSRRVRLRREPSCRVIPAVRDAAVRQFFFHHPLQPGPAFCMQHLTPVQAVGDGDAVLLILVAVTQACRVKLLHHPPRIVVAVAHLRPACITVRHHPAPVFIIVSKVAHLRTAAVIHRRQLTAWRPVVAHQWRGR